MQKITGRKIVVVNQAANYLTIGFTNAFSCRFEHVALITGSIHVQGEQLDDNIQVSRINKWSERPSFKKLSAYIIGCIRIYWLLMTRYRKYEVFFISLPPMAYLLSLVLPHRCSMVVWDVYPDVFKITGMSEKHLVYKSWTHFNKIAFKRAFRLYTIGERMGDLLEKYVKRKKIIIQPIWSIFQQNEKIQKSDNPFIKRHHLQGKFVVQYSGNIGLTHKVEVMVKLAEQMQDYPNILFQIIGRGPRVPALQNMVKEKNLPNCQFLPFQSDEMFPFSLSAADLGVVILDELTSKGSVPSKSYNLMSYGIPSLFIASEDSELNDYAEKFGHAYCCSESKLENAKNFIIQISQDKRKWDLMSFKAEEGAKQFTRTNADKFVERYLEY